MDQTLGTGLHPILDSFVALVIALNNFVGAIASSIGGLWALVIWIVFWLWFVRWPDLRTELRRGGWAAVLLLYVLGSLVWGLCSEPQYLTGLGLAAPFPALLEKFILSAIWVGIAFGCGNLQDQWKLAPEPVEIMLPPEGGMTPAAHGHASHH